MFTRILFILISFVLFAESGGRVNVVHAREPGHSLFSLTTPNQVLNEPHSPLTCTPVFGHSDAPLISPGAQQLRQTSTVPPCGEVCSPICETVCSEPCRCSPCDETGRRYALDIGVSLLTRSRPNGGALFVNPATTTENISASSLQPDSTVALETGLILYEQHHLTDLEFRALWMDDWTSRAVQAFTGSVVQFNANPVVGTTGPRNGTVAYRTDFFSTEANVRFRSPNKCEGRTWVVGGRVFLLDDLLTGEFADPAGVLPNENIRIATRNELIGAHFGADSVLKKSSRWCLKWSWRTGLYGNNGDQNSQLISLVAPPITFPASGGGGRLAWHAEGVVSGKFRLTDRANIVALYRLMYLDGLVLATDQLANTNFLVRQGLDDDGSLWLQSATLGFEVVY